MFWAFFFSFIDCTSQNRKEYRIKIIGCYSYFFIDHISTLKAHILKAQIIPVIVFINFFTICERLIIQPVASKDYFEALREMAHIWSSNNKDEFIAVSSFS